jgi:hypothetical protein
VLTCAEVAEKISQHAGIAARYVDIPLEAQRKAMLEQGMPEWQRPGDPRSGLPIYLE